MSRVDKRAVRKAFVAHYGSAPRRLREAIHPPHDPLRLQTAYVLAHSVRGDALAVGLSEIAQVAHALEKSLAEAKAQSERPGALVETLWSDACSVLERQLAQADREEPLDTDELLIRALGRTGKETD